MDDEASPQGSHNPLLTAALAYAKRGWPVLPLQPNDKPPLGRLVHHAFYDASTDPMTIVRWWTAEPSANVGIRTGLSSGLVILDVDPRAGGDTELFALEQQHGKLPETVEVLTGGGGRHLYFLHPGGIIKNITLKPGLEIKADGGYVVASPSGHPSGRSYVWECTSHPDEVPLAHLPEWLLEQAITGRMKTVRAGSVSSRIPEGQRNNTLASLAGTMRRRGMGPDSIVAALLSENEQRCDPPLPEEKVRKIATSIARYDPSTDEVAVTTDVPSSDPWPPSLATEGYYGLLGEIVRAIEPHSEADPVAILVQSLVAFGNVINRRPHFKAGSDHHALNLYLVLVGDTAKGRKGTSLGYVRALFQPVAPDWEQERVLSGLSSGEGLIWAVRDANEKQEPIRKNGRIEGYQSVINDHGIKDKRVLDIESEFASILRVLNREGNTLSAIMRQAWDSGHLRVLTKNSATKATGAHISIIGHITRDELRRYMDRTEIGNGFANRFLWVCGRRSKVLPEGGLPSEQDLAPLRVRLGNAIRFSMTADELHFDEQTRLLWHQVYADLTKGRPGLLGAVTSRAEAQVRRIACLYALLDCSAIIRNEHLRAALAVWDYCFESARYIFGDALGDPLADQLLGFLRAHPGGLTRTDIRDQFGRNRKANDIDRALRLLLDTGLARRAREETNGRTAERWIATQARCTTETT